MIILLVLFGILLIAADQFIKIWAVDVLKPVKVMNFIKFGDFEILGLRYVENTGAAFSSLSGKRWLLVAMVSIMLVAMLIFMIKYKYKHPFFMISSVMVMAGGIGNLIDRVRFGYVVDYLDVKLFNFAVFNFADVCVVLGAIFLLIFIFFMEPKIAAKYSETSVKEEKSDEQT